MQTFKFQEVIDFIKEQPDDKPIDFTTVSNDGIGCLITQFGRSKGVKFTSVSFDGDRFYSSSYDLDSFCYTQMITAIIEDFPDKDIFSYCSHAINDPDTFGLVKKNLGLQ